MTPFERRLTTLAEAQRQVWVRGIIGWLLGGLSLIFLLLMPLKYMYQAPANVLFPWGPPLRRFIDPLLDDWAVLALLWRAIPPWQPIPLIPTTSMWDLVYGMWGALVVTVVAVLLLRSAHARRAQITEFHWEMQREAWRQQARATGGVAPASRGQTTVIGQAIWHEYAAPPESWSQTIWGILFLGLIVALVSGLILLYAEYSFFQAYWPSSRN